MATIKSTYKQEKQFQGVPTSPGIVFGDIYISQTHQRPIERRVLASEELEAETHRFRDALERAKTEISTLQSRTEESIGQNNAEIFETHRLMLDDDMIVDGTLQRIRDDKVNAEHAFSETMQVLEHSLSQSHSDHFKLRTQDLRDIKRRVLTHLQGQSYGSLANLEKPAVIVSHELTPSDTVEMDREKVAGFATDIGGKTSHAAIMARALRIPSVVGLGDISKQVENGDPAIIDGTKGMVIVHPSEKTISTYQNRLKEYLSSTHRLEKIRDLPARTQDGKDIELSANIEFPEESRTIQESGGYGVGLYRTEYLYMTRSTLPSEEEQYQEYVSIIESLGDHPLIIRTLDVGGDKLPATIELPPEENPFLGARGVRLYMTHETLFRTQLRAIYRASVRGNVRILLPMISSVSEMRYCKDQIEQVKRDLEHEGLDHRNRIPLGATIEVPSSAVIADLIARECDFLSIGTNDLIQYTLAVDRGNEHVAHLYQGYHPAVLRFIQDIIQRGHQEGVWVGMCGELASDPLATMVLIGLGLDEFSVSPVSILLVKEIIRRVDYTECEKLTQRVLSFHTTKEVQTYLQTIMRRKFKDLQNIMQSDASSSG
jgi:phosphotransferase system enzyme I (PtsI)